VGEKRNSYRNLALKPKGKRLLGRPRHRRENNIQMNRKGIRFECVEWLLNSGNSWTSFLRRTVVCGV
jgi:hypothetical protein